MIPCKPTPKAIGSILCTTATAAPRNAFLSERLLKVDVEFLQTCAIDLPDADPLAHQTETTDEEMLHRHDKWGNFDRRVRARSRKDPRLSDIG